MEKTLPKTYHEFPNGFRIIYEKSPNKNNISYINCFCHIGSIHETDKTHGASHMIEHMCFKGSTRFPTSQKITDLFDKTGSSVNAFTEQKYTCYVIKCLDHFLFNLITVLSDMLLCSLFDKDEYKRERDVVIQENSNNENDHENIIYNAICSLIYKDTPYQYPVDCLDYHRGNKYTPFNYDDIVNMYKKYYQPQNMVLSLVSNISFDHFMNLIKRTYFVEHKNKGSLYQERNNSYLIERPLVVNKNNEPTILLISQKGQTTCNISISFQTCSFNNREMYILQLIKVYLGDLLNSRLFVVLREKNGVVYTSNVSSEYQSTSGFF